MLNNNNKDNNNKKLPFGELGIISLKSCKSLGKKIDNNL